MRDHQIREALSEENISVRRRHWGPQNKREMRRENVNGWWGPQEVLCGWKIGAPLPCLTSKLMKMCERRADGWMERKRGWMSRREWEGRRFDSQRQSKNKLCGQWKDAAALSLYFNEQTLVLQFSGMAKMSFNQSFFVFFLCSLFQPKTQVPHFIALSVIPQHCSAFI